MKHRMNWSTIFQMTGKWIEEEIKLRTRCAMDDGLGQSFSARHFELQGCTGHVVLVVLGLFVCCCFLCLNFWVRCSGPVKWNNETVLNPPPPPPPPSLLHTKRDMPQHVVFSSGSAKGSTNPVLPSGTAGSKGWLFSCQRAWCFGNGLVVN